MNISLTFHNTSKFQKPDKLHSPMNLSENISSKSKVYASIPDELIPLRLKKISPSSLAHFFLEYPEERHTFLHYFEKFSLHYLF